MSKEENKEVKEEVVEEIAEETAEDVVEEKKEPDSDEIIEGLKAELDKAKNDVGVACVSALILASVSAVPSQGQRKKPPSLIRSLNSS